MGLFPASMFPNQCTLAHVIYGQDGSLGRTEGPVPYALGVPCTVQRLDPDEQFAYHSIEANANVFVGFMSDPGLLVHDQITQTDTNPNRTFTVVEVEDECGIRALWGAYCSEVQG
jgi:hypothetical protein